jgi:hypothetical protein
MGANEDPATANKPAESHVVGDEDRVQRSVEEWAVEVGIDPAEITRVSYHEMPEEQFGATYNEAKDGGHGYTIPAHTRLSWVAKGHQFRGTGGVPFRGVGVQIRILADKRPRHPGDEYWYAANTRTEYRRAVWMEEQWTGW